MERLARLGVVALVAGLVALSGLFALPPLDRDESRFAQATAQMLETGDFVSINFQAAERNKKPAGVHWLQAASVTMFSSVEAREIWAYRLPSAAGAVIAAIFTYLAGARLFGPQTGLLAALLLASAPLFAAEGTIAKTDAALLAAICAAQTAFIHIVGKTRDGTPAGWLWPLIFWSALGAGILLKGPIAPLVVVATGAGLLFLERRADWLADMRPLAGLALLALIVAPWAIAIGAATEGRFFTEAIGGDMVAKFGAAQEHHSGPPGYHLVLLAVLFWPAAALIAPGAALALAGRRAFATAFLLAWIVPCWILFELTATKLPHYVLPLYPALAILAARAAQAGAAPRWALLRLGAGAYAAVGLGVAGALMALPRFFSGAPLAPVSYGAGALVAVGSIFIAALFWRGRTIGGAYGAIALAALVDMTLLGGVLPRLDRLAVSPRLAAAFDEAGLHPLRDGAPPAAVAGYYEPSAVFLLGTATALTDGAGAARHLRDVPGAGAAVEERQEAQFHDAARSLGLAPRALAVVDGFNYSNGRDVRLRLYAIKPPS